MNDIFVGIGIIVFIYLLYLLIIILNDRRLKKYINNSKETNLIKARFNINFDKISYKYIANIFALDNAFIIGITYMVVSFIDNYILKLLVAFLMFMLLVVVSYLFIGSLIKKKEGK